MCLMDLHGLSTKPLYVGPHNVLETVSCGEVLDGGVVKWLLRELSTGVLLQHGNEGAQVSQQRTDPRQHVAGGPASVLLAQTGGAGPEVEDDGGLLRGVALGQPGHPRQEWHRRVQVPVHLAGKNRNQRPNPEERPEERRQPQGTSREQTQIFSDNNHLHLAHQGAHHPQNRSCGQPRDKNRQAPLRHGFYIFISTLASY
mmetsp:Transcript_31990/g.50230  ORF Transcript_31990/g.50230 Transcript_31990/m.50230 type:complete len:200 (+) Transcript_31990:607-1206(+)